MSQDSSGELEQCYNFNISSKLVRRRLREIDLGGCIVYQKSLTKLKTTKKGIYYGLRKIGMKDWAYHVSDEW